MKKLTLQNIHEWPKTMKYAVYAIAFVLIVALGYQFIISSKMTDLDKAHKKEDELKTQIEFVIRKVKQLDKQVSALPDLQNTLTTWNKQLVDYNDLPELMNNILKIGGENRLTFSTFSPGEPELVQPLKKEEKEPTSKSRSNAKKKEAPKEPEITFSKLPIKAVAAGSYHDIAEFISQVANMKWIVVIENFTILRNADPRLLGDKLAKQAKEQGLLTTEISLDVYYLPERQK